MDHQEGDSFSAGTDLLGSGVLDAASLSEAVDAAGPIWKRMGFGAPTNGVKRLGSVFDASPEELKQGTVVAYHVTRQNGDVYETVGFPINVRLDETTGRLNFSPLEGSGITAN